MMQLVAALDTMVQWRDDVKTVLMLHQIGKISVTQH